MLGWPDPYVFSRDIVAGKSPNIRSRTPNIPDIPRDGQNRTDENTAYLDTPYNRIRVWKFWPYLYPYDRTWILADRVYTPYVQSNRICARYILSGWTLFAGGAGSDSQQQQSFLLFLVNFLLSRLSLLSSSFAFLFYWCICFALIISCTSGYGSWTPFCTEKGLCLVFLAWSRPSSRTIHIFGFKRLGHAHSALQELQNDPPMNSSWVNPPSLIYGIYGSTAYIRSYTACTQYMEIPCRVWANP